MIKVKPGVTFTVIAPAGFLILQAMKYVSKLLGMDLTITSGTDGEHSGPLDPHKVGEAYDVRSHDMRPPQKSAFLMAIMNELGTAHFYGLLEGLNTPDEHFHVQKAKGTTFSAEDLLNA